MFWIFLLGMFVMALIWGLATSKTPIEQFNDWAPRRGGPPPPDGQKYLDPWEPMTESARRLAREKWAAWEALNPQDE
jgi:hypothetical protein